jgi:metallo-beta-lactamase class B
VTRLTLLVALCALALAAQSSEASAWSKPFPPHKIVGNVYYVGSNELASFLIATPAGHILINTGFEETVPVVRAGCEKLGFKLSDVKILLTGQAHNDHVAGFALMRKLTGAKVMVMAGDDAVVRGGGKGDFAYESQMRWAPCPVDRVLQDGDQVTLGSTTLVARLTPGHTRGCTTWLLTAVEDGKPFHVVIVGSVHVNSEFRLVNNAKYPRIAEDFARTFQVLESLPCDVFLGSHGGAYGMQAKYQRSLKEGYRAFVDPQGYRAYLAAGKAAYLKELEKQRGY